VWDHERTRWGFDGLGKVRGTQQVECLAELFSQSVIWGSWISHTHLAKGETGSERRGMI
jgi:hypothetical protein